MTDGGLHTKGYKVNHADLQYEYDDNGNQEVIDAAVRTGRMSNRFPDGKIYVQNQSGDWVLYSSNAAKGVGKGFESFSAFKQAFGSAGKGNAWHHIVEQGGTNIQKFGGQAIHNTNNLVKLPHGRGTIHSKISGYYSSKQRFTNGKTVRKWLQNKPFKEQYNFGIQKLKEFGWTP